jgi:hypothetical protein
MLMDLSQVEAAALVIAAICGLMAAAYGVFRFARYRSDTQYRRRREGRYAAPTHHQRPRVPRPTEQAGKAAPKALARTRR